MSQLESAKIDPGRAKEKNSFLNRREQKELRSIVGKLNWAAQGTRPDMAFDVVELSSHFQEGKVSDLIRANKDILKLKQCNSSRIMFPVLGPLNRWRIVVFADAALANMSDGVSSAGGHVIFLAGLGNKCAVIAWSCAKIKRVVRSTLAAEMLSLSEALDHAIYLRHVLREITGYEGIKIEAFTDNLSVEEALLSTKCVDDKRLRIDVGAVKQMIADGTIENVKWIPGSLMIANTLTKRGASCFDILEVIQRGQFSMLV